MDIKLVNSVNQKGDNKVWISNLSTLSTKRVIPRSEYQTLCLSHRRQPPRRQVVVLVAMLTSPCRRRSKSMSHEDKTELEIARKVHQDFFRSSHNLLTFYFFVTFYYNFLELHNQNGTRSL